MLLRESKEFVLVVDNQSFANILEVEVSLAVVMNLLMTEMPREETFAGARVEAIAKAAPKALSDAASNFRLTPTFTVSCPRRQDLA